MIQLLIIDDLRGSVMVVFSTIFIGIMPIRSISSDVPAEIIGVRNTVYSPGIVSIFSACSYLLLTKVTDEFK